MVERDDLPVNDAVRQSGCNGRDRAEFGRPVQTLAGLQGNFAVLDPQLDAVTVKLDLVDPVGADGRTLN